MIVLSQIHNKLVTAIKDSGLTQTAIAKRLGVSQQTIGQYLSGRAMPALDTFANLCAVLELDPAEILCLNDFDGTPKKIHLKDSFNNNSGSINFKA